MKQLIWIGIFSLGAISVIAAPGKKGKPAPDKVGWGTPYQQVPIDETSRPDFTIVSEAVLQKELQEAKTRGDRHVAAEVTDSKNQDFRDIRDLVLALKDTPGSSDGADKLDQILFKLESKEVLEGPKTSNELRFFAAQLMPLRSFRGFFHKIRKLAFKYPIVQSYLVTLAKQFSSNIGIFLTNPDFETTPSSDHMRVFFRYVSEPYSFNMARKGAERPELNFDKIKDVQFKGVSTFASEADIQNWLEGEVYVRLKIATATIGNINLVNDTIVWDNRIITGSQAYQDGIDRFRTLGQAERNAVLSNFYGNMANIKIYCSYSQTRALELVSELGFLYGVEQFDRFIPGADFKGDKFVKGASAWERTKEVTSFIDKQISFGIHNDGPVIYTLLPRGPTNMKEAYASALNSSQVAMNAWKEIKARKDDDSSMALDGGIFRPFIGSGDKSLNAMEMALVGSLNKDQISAVKVGDLKLSGEEIENNFVSLRSAVSGETIHVNVVKFFYAPPKNLKDFMPVFPKKMEEHVLTSSALDDKGRKVEYRDYTFGTANQWNAEKINTYFRIGVTPLPVLTGEDVKRVLRVTNQSWGGLMIGMPLTSIML